MSRREAMGSIAAGAAAVLGLPALACGGASSGRAGITPGLQLYTVRAAMQDSVESTLARVASIGYKEVEFAGYFGRAPEQIAAVLKVNGLTAPAAHVSLDALGDGWAQVLDGAAAMGHTWVVVAFLTPAQRGGADAYKRLAGVFNVAGEVARQHGITLAYHNHDFEFQPLGDTDGHAILLSECDPGLVQFELDLYWVTKAGKDAAAYMAKYPGRFPLVHVKDMGADGMMTEVGAGSINFQQVIDAAKSTIRHYFVEQDNAKVPFESITTSLAALQRLHP